MCWPGAPTLYYGDEAGLAGWTDPDNRRPFPWGKENLTLTRLHKVAIKLRKSYSALRTGSVEFLWSEYGVLSFGRWDDNKQIAVVLNNNPWPKEIRLPVWKMGLLNGQMICPLSTDYTRGGAVYEADTVHQVVDGMVSLTVPEFGSMVLVSM